MSNAARKARKRANNIGREQDGIAERYQHPIKVGTPFEYRTPNQTMRGIDGYGPSRRGMRRLRALAMASTGQPSTPPLGVFPDSSEYFPEKAETEELKLDPKPYRIGRKRYTLDDLQDREIEKAAGQPAIFSPRKGYETDGMKYSI